MNTRVDFVSEKTGRVLLSSLFDTPPDGLTRRDCQKVITILRRTKDKLETVVGQGTVRLTVDDYPSSVFWYLVLFRPVVFDSDDPWFGGKPWSVFEMLEDPARANKLKEMDLGIVYDPDRNWLSVVWEEARTGILEDLENTPTWRKILKEQEKRLGYWPTDEWWKLCAKNHAFVVPNWRVARQGYLRGVLWHRPRASYDDVIVFDLAGVDLPTLNEAGDAELPVAKRANFTHFYTEDKREFNSIRKNLIPRTWAKTKKSKASIRSKQQRKKRKEEKAAWIDASYAIADIQKAMGGGTPGRRSMFMSAAQTVAQFEELANKFSRDLLRITPNDDIAWALIESKLDVLEQCLHDPSVPQEMSIWLRWRDKGKNITPED